MRRLGGWARNLKRSLYHRRREDRPSVRRALLRTRLGAGRTICFSQGHQVPSRRGHVFRAGPRPPGGFILSSSRGTHWRRAALSPTDGCARLGAFARTADERAIGALLAKAVSPAYPWAVGMAELHPVQPSTRKLSPLWGSSQPAGTRRRFAWQSDPGASMRPSSISRPSYRPPEGPSGRRLFRWGAAASSRHTDCPKFSGPRRRSRTPAFATSARSTPSPRAS